MLSNSPRNTPLSSPLLADLATIPAHDPDRYKTTDGFDNPNCTNGARGTFASEALASF